MLFLLRCYIGGCTLGLYDLIYQEEKILNY